MRDRLITRAAGERGMTLPEVLVTLVIGMIITLATFSLVDVTMRRSGEISARVDAVQRGRSAMDSMTRQLRSQVCVQNGAWPAGTMPRSVEAASATSVTFYADMRDTSAGAAPAGDGPERRQLSLEGYTEDANGNVVTEGSIVERRWAVDAFGPTTYSYDVANPDGARELLGHAVPERKTGQPSTPLFKYFAYNFVAPAGVPQATYVPQPTLELAPDPVTHQLTAANLQRVAKIQIAYRAQPAQPRKDGRASTVFVNDVAVRTVDPNSDQNELANPCL